ncbi:L,D-transpeptidase family protein [Marimonas arenosa]|uniref:L,D-transpeptidase family protein n=1 Tax=Marimonas arenosa TaxID=1795305 RepID=A0AAE3WCP4_9RHOB|nr:L,D-transpeptidase family protein [Marimonas arenosa]MDQ2090068.1 L,D-transpeptidase family protein [Marimonas arenosa]
MSAGDRRPGVRRFRRVAIAVVIIFLVVTAGLVYWPAEPLPKGFVADRVVVEKSARRLSLLRDGQVIKSYRVSLGRAPVGAKIQEGDNRTPEGTYVIDSRNPRSKFHLSLRISYPNASDSLSAARRGVSPGGDIMVHGLPNGREWVGPFHRLVDWTSGCIAVTNAEINEIWQAVPNGTAIEIRP